MFLDVGPDGGLRRLGEFAEEDDKCVGSGNQEEKEYIGGAFLGEM